MKNSTKQLERRAMKNSTKRFRFYVISLAAIVALLPTIAISSAVHAQDSYLTYAIVSVVATEVPDPDNAGGTIPSNQFEMSWFLGGPYCPAGYYVYISQNAESATLTQIAFEDLFDGLASSRTITGLIADDDKGFLISIYCDESSTNQLIGSVIIPVDSTNRAIIEGNYTSEPTIFALRLTPGSRSWLTTYYSAIDIFTFRYNLDLDYTSQITLRPTSTFAYSTTYIQATVDNGVYTINEDDEANHLSDADTSTPGFQLNVSSGKKVFGLWSTKTIDGSNTELNSSLYTLTVTGYNKQLNISGHNASNYRENSQDIVASYGATYSTTPNIGSYHAIVFGNPIWSLSGDDSDDFAINTYGELSFTDAPDYENPTDSNLDNIYNITIDAVGANSISAEMDVVITVTDENEGPVIN